MQKFSWLILVLILIILGLVSRYSKSNETEEEIKNTTTPELSSSLHPSTSPNPNIFPTVNLKSLNEETASEILMDTFRGNLATLKLKARRLLVKKKDSFPLLLNALEDPHVELRLWSLKTLSDFRDAGCLPYVLPLLKDTNPQIVIEALETLQKLPKIQACDAVLHLLKHSHFRVRLSTIQTLTILQCRETVPLLLTLLKQLSPQEDPQDILKGSLLEAFAVLSGPDLLDEIEPYLFSKHPKGVAGASRIFWEWTDRRLYPVMIQHYQQIQNRQILEILARKPEVAPYFVSLLNLDIPPEAMNLALNVISKEKYLEATEPLKVLLVNRPEFKPSITSTLMSLGVELTDIQDHAGALQGVVTLFELYPDLNEQIVWRRAPLGKKMKIQLRSQNEDEKLIEIDVDERGRFRFPELKVGTYNLSLHEAGIESYQTTLVITAQMVGIPIHLLKKKSEIAITFEVSDPQLEKIPQVKIRFDFGKYFIEKWTDSQGTIVFDNLIPGKYSVEIYHPEYQIVKKTYHWKQSESLSIQLEKR